MPSCDEIAAAWLSGTEFAGDPHAVRLLSRAISPGEFAVRRDFLPVTATTDPATSATILQLLEHGQVPTMAAIRSRTAQNEMRKQAEHIEQLGKRAQRSIDDFGRALARFADNYWIANGTGPTRRDALCSEPVLTLIRSRIGDIAPSAIKHLWLIERVQRAGWIAYSAEQGSLCAARRFHSARFAHRVSRRPANVIGALVARYLADQLASNGQPPTWPLMAHELRDDLNRPVFGDTADARTQQLWLTTAGWIELDEQLPVPGPRGRRTLARAARP